MPTIVVLGSGPLGRAVADAATNAGHDARVLGRPTGARHDPTAFEGADLVVEASTANAVLENVTSVLDGGVRRIVIATTAWDSDRQAVEELVTSRGATVVASANFSLGAALFGRLVEDAVALFGSAGFDPFLVEWHRAGKRDRPSGTARDLARRIVAGHPGLREADDLEVVSIRAGVSPGMHLVGFDALGETVELRLTARDRSAYAVGILAAADWLTRAPRTPGIHTFDPVVDALLARPEVAA
jgi:4-hydroxy-tetrahydrodipicolinate reductase